MSVARAMVTATRVVVEEEGDGNVGKINGNEDKEGNGVRRTS